MTQPDHTSEVTLEVDGHRHSLTVDNRITLLDTLRERLGATAPKKGVTTASAGRAPS